MGIPATLSTVPAQTPYIQYVATSGQTVYPYPFEITQDSDLTIVYNGVTLGTDSGYTVSGVGNSTGGDATFTSGATAGDIVTLYRDIPIERLTQFGQNSGFSSTAFNAEFNNVYLLLQQLQQNIDQCLQIPNTNNPAPTVSLTPAAYANKYLAFDGNGNPEPAVLTSSGSLTASILGGLLWPKSAGETVAGVTPVNPYYFYGDVRRYGAVCDSGTTDNTGAVTDALAANAGYFPVNFYPVSGKHYSFTSRVVVPGNSVVNFNGAALQWSATAADGSTFPATSGGSAAKPGFEISGNDVVINFHGGSMTGPSSDAYVANEFGIYLQGGTLSTPRSRIAIHGPGKITQWGYGGIVGQFTYDTRVENLHVTGCGYVGIGFLSAIKSRVRDNEVDTITPGSSSNAYGIFHSYDNANNSGNSRPGSGAETDPYSAECEVAGNLVHDIPLWEGIDWHAGFDGSCHDNRIYNCAIGIHVADGLNSSGTSYGGQNFRVHDNLIDISQMDGSATTVAVTTPSGILTGGGTGANAVNYSIHDNVIIGYGNTVPSSYSIKAVYMQRANIHHNELDSWQGYGIYAAFVDGEICNNNFGAMGATMSSSTCIYTTDVNSLVINGNRHRPASGDVAVYGIDIADAGDNRQLHAGNDFGSCSSAAVTTSGGVNGGYSLSGSDLAPIITVTSVSSNTVDVSVAGLQAREVHIWFNTTGSNTVKQLANATAGCKYVLYQQSNETTTFDRTNAALASATSWAGTQYSTLVLYCKVGGATPSFTEISRVVGPS